jgi:hypothetical protein
MNLINPDSIEGIINHFANHLLEQVGDNLINENTFQVSYYFPFIMVVSGTVSSDNEFFDLPKQFEIFKEKFKYDFPNKKLRFIDNIRYNTSSQYHQNWHRFYNTPRPLYNEYQLTTYIEKDYQSSNIVSIGEDYSNVSSFFYNDFNISYLSNSTHHSQFPHGYSKELRTKLYSMEFIAYNMFRVSKSPVMDIHTWGNTPEEFTLNDNMFKIRTKSRWSNEKLSSVALDVLCDYNINEAIEYYDINDDLFLPIADKPWNEHYKMDELILF